jgi:cell volume regulation protein A
MVILRPATRRLVDQVFADRTSANVEELAGLEFPLRGTTMVAELEDMYGMKMETRRDLTLVDAMRQRLGDTLAVGQSARFGPIRLRVRRVATDQSIEQLGMTILPDLGDSESPTANNQRES